MYTAVDASYICRGIFLLRFAKIYVRTLAIRLWFSYTIGKTTQNIPWRTESWQTIAAHVLRSKTKTAQCL